MRKRRWGCTSPSLRGLCLSVCCGPDTHCYYGVRHTERLMCVWLCLWCCVETRYQRGCCIRARLLMGYYTRLCWLCCVLRRYRRRGCVCCTRLGNESGSLWVAPRVGGAGPMCLCVVGVRVRKCVRGPMCRVCVCVCLRASVSLSLALSLSA